MAARAVWAAPLLAGAATFAVRPLARPEGPLEPSVQNEVDHALDLGEAWLAAHGALPTNGLALCSAPLFATGGVARADLALRLVSAQKGEGWWLTPTNAAPTRLALEILKGL